MKYKIIESKDLETLQLLVNDKIRNGWTLQGGVSISLNESDDYVYFSCAQAVTFDEKKESES